MLRPYCGKEMKAGFVQAASNSIFSEKKHLVRMQPANDQEVLLAEQTSVSYTHLTLPTNREV